MASRLLCVLTALGIALAVTGITNTAIAADPDPCQASGGTVTNVYKADNPASKKAVELGNKIAVQIDTLENLTRLRTEATCRKKPVVLFVNGEGTENQPVGLTANGALLFFLRHAGGTHDFWNSLLGRPDFNARPVHVTV